MISVLLMTSNHERFIGQALDGVLGQKVDFQYEVLVGEENSTDRTREVLKKYKNKFAKKLKSVNFRNTKDVSSVAPGRANFLRLH